MSQVVRTKGASDEPEVASQPPAAEKSRYVEGEIIVDKYKLVSQLAEGGMGSLWVAKNIALDALVALKLIRTDVAREGAEERFLTEARAAARLKHPSIVRVFDFGRTRRNEPFIVMELLHGETLGEVLDREKRVPATYAVQVLLPIVDALAAAHAKDVIHRDLKPDNIYLSESDGRVVPKILDFGIAKLQTSPVTGHRITQAGTVVGSPDYLSPEQARGFDEIDHRADIWALTVLLYECITGRVPFEDASYNALLRHIIEDDVPSILEFAAGDSELWVIMEKGFKKRPDERYQTMRELGEALALWLLARGVTEDVTGHSLRTAWLESNSGNVSRPSLPGYRDSLPSLKLVPETLRPAGPPTVEIDAEIPRRRRRTQWAFALALVAFGVAGFAAVRATLSTRSATPASSTPPPPASAEARTSEPATGHGPRTGPTPAEPSATAPAAPTRTAPQREPRPTKAAAPAPKPSASVEHPSPAPPPTAKPKGAYGEDLGF